MKSRLTGNSARGTKSHKIKTGKSVNGELPAMNLLNEDNYRDIVENSGSIIMKTDRELNITYMNNFGLNFFGYTIDEVLGRNVIGTTIAESDESGRDLVNMAQEIMSNPQLFKTNVHQYMRKSGELVWLSWSNNPVYDKDGNLTEFLAIGNDVSNLVKAETALKESEIRSRMLVRYAPTGIYELDYQTPKFLSVNDSMCEITGYSREEFHSMDPFQLLDENSVLIFRDRIRKILSGERVKDNVDYKIKAKDGREIWATLNIKILEETGRPPRALVVANDITALKQAEDELHRERNLFECVMQNTDVMLAYLDKDFNFFWVNNAYAKSCKMESHELTGRNHFILFPDPENESIFRRVRDTGSSVFFKDKPFVYPDQPERGTTYWDWSLVPVKNKDGTVAGLVFSLSETTKYKLQEIALSTSVERYRMLHETMRDAFVQADMTGQIIDCNDVYCELLGFSRDEILTLTYQQLTPECWHSMEAELIKSQILSRGFSDVYEKEYRRKDGTIVPVELRTILARDSEGQPANMWGIVRDITERKHLEEKLKKYNERLEEQVRIRSNEILAVNEELLRSNKELENFAYVASHDLQEPLRMITSFTQLLEKQYRDKLDGNAKEYMDFVVDGAKRMYELINGLLAYSRISRKEIAHSVVDLNSIVDIVRANLAVTIKERDCIIECANLPAVIADPNQMTQLFQNLISNGIKFSNDQPTISITCRIEKDRHVISIRDKGIGIESIYFDKIFQIFKRLMPIEKYEGTGIGLAICKKIIENHKGEIWVESEPGKGSAFCFTLPVKDV